MKQEGMAAEVPSKQDAFSEWYTAVVLKAELADYAPVRGCMVIRPYGYSLWENMREGLDRRFRATGHVNAYFPLFVPESLLKKEAEHVKGFAPQVAWVTIGGDEELTERLALRPTSEAIICSMYSKWVKSYRDLPVLINQWCNIVRWEKSTRLFLRTREFLWQEGHTCHRTEEEGEVETLKILDLYRDFAENDMAIPVIAGRKPESEKFPGAKATYGIEALMPDGQALQAGTSHNLGQFFSRAFDIKFLDADNTEKFAWGTSWGVSTRLIGGLIMTHGDDSGLVLPPRLAPVQVVIVPILFGKEDDKVLAKARALHDLLAAHVRVHLDARPDVTPGWKYNDWEMRGVPLRLEIGPKDIAKNQVVLKPRVSFGDTVGTRFGIVSPTGGSGHVSGKQFVPEAGLIDTNKTQLAAVQKALFEKAKAFQDSRISDASSLDEFTRKLAEKPGFVRIHWCGDRKCEDEIRVKTGTTPRVIPLHEPSKGKCLVCGAETDTVIYYARAY
jgi:prolyl-tRNA synthetase